MLTNKTDKTILNLMIIVTALLLILIIGNNIKTSLYGTAMDTQNYEKRKRYYEEVIKPAKLDLHPAKHYIILNK